MGGSSTSRSVSELPFDGKLHVLGVIRDISEEAAAYRLLEERVADRTRELSGLLDVAVHLAAVVDAAQIGDVLEQDAPAVLPRCGFSVWQLRDTDLLATTPDRDRQRINIERLPKTMALLRAGQLVRCSGPDPRADLFGELVDAGMAQWRRPRACWSWSRRSGPVSCWEPW